jgi:hypothetical protein
LVPTEVPIVLTFPLLLEGRRMAHGDKLFVKKEEVMSLILREGGGAGVTRSGIRR